VLAFKNEITPVVPEAPKTVENKGSGQTKKRKEQEPSRRTSIKP